MKKSVLIIGILILIDIIFALISYLYFSNFIACTKKGCFCSENVGEIPCNDCSITKPVLITGIFNIVKNCRAKEIILCENSKQSDIRYDIDNSNCRYSYLLFIVPIV